MQESPMLAAISPSTFRHVSSLRRLLLSDTSRFHVEGAENRVVLLCDAPIFRPGHPCPWRVVGGRFFSSNARRNDDAEAPAGSGKEEVEAECQHNGGAGNGKAEGKVDKDVAEGKVDKEVAEVKVDKEVVHDNEAIRNTKDEPRAAEDSAWRRIPKQISRALFGESPKEVAKEVPKEAASEPAAEVEPATAETPTEPVVAEASEQAAGDSAGKGGSSGAIVPAGPRPENFPKVPSSPKTQNPTCLGRPLFTGCSELCTRV